MYSEFIQPYSKKEIKEIEIAFKNLAKFRGSKSVQDYLKKRRAEFKV